VPLTIPLEKRGRALADWPTKLQHLIGGVPLLFVGISKLLHDPAERSVAAFEVFIAAAVVLTFVKELKTELRNLKHQHGAHAHPAVGWFDLAAGILLIYEAFHGAHHKPGYLRPQFLSGVTTLGLGIFHGRLQQRRARAAYITLDERGFDFRRNRFRRLRLQWSEIATIDQRPNEVTFSLKSGSTRSISLRTFRNGDEIRQAISQQFDAAQLSAPR
jgi:uncharacterized membrane protein HdeD (DUF308 family)